MTIKALKIDSRGYKLLALVERNGKTSSKYVIVAHSFFEERVYSDSTVENFLRACRRLGLTTVKVDYAGSGDSDGDDGVFSLSMARDNFLDTMAFATEQMDMLPTAILGVRVGGQVAIPAIKIWGDKCLCILWDPVMNMAEYARGLVRKNIAYQMATLGKVVSSAEETVGSLGDGGKINIGGYTISAKVFNECLSCENVLPDNFNPRFVGIASIGHLGKDLRAEHKKLEESLKERLIEYKVTHLSCPAFWAEQKFRVKSVEKLNDITIDWLKRYGQL